VDPCGLYGIELGGERESVVCSAQRAEGYPHFFGVALLRTTFIHLSHDENKNLNAPHFFRFSCRHGGLRWKVLRIYRKHSARFLL